MSGSDALLEINRLSLSYRVGGLALRGLKNVSLTLDRGRILGVVGESGSGKSTLSFAIPRLLPKNARIEGGSIRFAGTDMSLLSEATLETVRGARIAMIFQDPLSSLHPCMTIGRQMSDAQRAHGRSAARERRTKAIEMLRLVGLSDPEQNLDRYPHQFSGGMRQRIMIATALLLQPDLLIADEPTSALDVVLQDQIVGLLTGLRDRLGTAILIVSHDLGVVGDAADDILVMYAGEVMEYGPAGEIIGQPLHPYTQALIRVMPSRRARGRALPTIPGRVPNAREPIIGCAFAGRCEMTRSVCYAKRPVLSVAGERKVRCHIHDLASGWHDAPKLSEPVTA
jgi:oligopeptide/dipeptide ABC transporter ATP-binding protein